jgi:coenzyme F420-reducing hydrogenase delta subunit
MASQKVLLITCNWNAYSGLETAGADRLSYPVEVYPLKVSCLGQVDPGLILKAFEHGALGVLMLGCPPDRCHYEFGSRRAEEVYAQAKELVRVSGCQEAQFRLDWISVGEGGALVDKLQDFLAGLNGGWSRR